MGCSCCKELLDGLQPTLTPTPTPNGDGRAQASDAKCRKGSGTDLDGKWPELRSEKVTIRPHSEMARSYKMQGELGKGAYGAVLQATNLNTRGVCAIKSAAKDDEDTQYEVEIFWSVHHPLVVNMFEAFEDKKKVYIVMEVCSGGTLTKKVASRSGTGLKMQDVARYVSHMFSGIAYLHYHAIVHRDIKPDNYLLHSPDVLAPLKLSDFGFACHYDVGATLTLRVGSSEWVAPEVIEGAYTEKCDIWSLGAVVYYCCVGYAPFSGATDLEILKKVRKAAFTFVTDDWAAVKPEFQALVKECMDLHFSPRPSAWKIAVPSVTSKILDDSLAFRLQQLNEQLADFGAWCWAPMYLDWRDGRSLSGLVHRMREYNGVAVLLIKTTQREVFGAVADRWQEGGGAFLGGSACFIFSLAPTPRAFLASGKSPNHMYLNCNKRNLPRGLGFGGKKDFWRIWVDIDFDGCYVLREDMTYESGTLLPGNDGKINFFPAHLEVWGSSQR